MQYFAINLYYIIIFGGIMEVLAYGVEFKNRKGEFCTRSQYGYYFVSHFRTDYMLDVGGSLVRGRAGDIYIATPGIEVYHGPTPEMQDGFVNDWMYVDGEDLGALLERYPLPIGVPFRIDDPFFLTSVTERISRELSYCEVGYEDKCDLLLSDMVIELYRSYKRNCGIGREARLDRVRGELMKNYMKEWTLSDIAKLSGYSESRLSSLYKGAFGTSPINDLIDRRIEQAKLLLLYGNLSVNEIAEAVGFSSIFYFSKQFKKREGMSPTEFKRSSENPESDGEHRNV